MSFYFFNFLLFLGVVTIVVGIKLDDYCKPDSGNTPCRTECKRSSSCGQTADKFAHLTDDERERVLQKHNELREAVAKGDYSSQNLPACDGGIKVMSYDKEMEFLAACHIKACDFNHDKVRLNSKGEKCGQNLHMAIMSAPSGFPETFLEDGIQSWFNEISLVHDSGIVANFPSAKGIGHLTALIWGETELVGCAKMHYTSSKKHYYSLFCDYFPAGNMIGAPIYKDGTCEKNPVFGNLCGKIRLLADDTYSPPLDLSSGFTLGAWSLCVYLFWNMMVLIL
ncbi:venom allergen 5-like [Atheta coriaria]|uniref:venom allergen 5-like n=1 Tax=Dalotia coriaria TaxID=877792 RepID=UPI0031F3CE7F